MTHDADASLSALQSFVPLALCHELAPTLDGAPTSKRMDAVVMFADVSGFSRLADRLFRRYGTAGGELLTGFLARFFGELVEVTQRYGGEIVKWSGDAFLAIWRESDFEGQAILHASACAHALVKNTLTPEQVPDVTLRVRAAITAGELIAARVGGFDDQWELVVTGAPVRQIQSALKAAPPSSTVLSEEASQRLRKLDASLFSPVEKAPTLSLLERAPSVTPRKLATPEVDASAVRALLPEVIRTRLARGDASWFAEVRQVTSVFLLAHEFDLREAGDTTLLHQAVRACQEAMQKHGGVLAQAGADDKGIWFLGAFGLPPTRGEIRAEDTLVAAAEAHQALRKLGLKASGGVASGRAFCGIVGTESRREFTFTSRVINLSARLMGRSQDLILVDPQTASRALHAVQLEERAPEQFAGFDEPLITYALKGTQRQKDEAVSGSAHFDAVARVKERAALADALKQLEQNVSTTVLIEADAGFGKTALVRDLLSHASCRVLVARGERALARTPYGAFRRLFAGLLDVPLTLDDEAGRREAEARFRQTHPELADQTALLRDVLPFASTESAESEGEGLVRAENARRLLVTLLEQATAGGALIVIDDAHALDGLSWKLLVSIATQLPNVMTLVTMRPLSEPPRELAAITSDARTTKLRLEPFDNDAVHALVASRAAKAPDHLVAWLVRRSGGNPFFITELLTSLLQSGTIRVHQGQNEAAQLEQVPSPSELDALAIPLDVESIVTSRVDHLDPDTQRVLKAASVVGSDFSEDLLAHALERSEEANKSALEALTADALLEAHPDGYRFPNDTLLKVAYELIPTSQRDAIHERLATLLAQRHGNDTTFAPVLAHHWDRTQKTVEALDALEHAGLVAMQSGAFREAAHFFARAQQRVVGERSDGRSVVSVTPTREAEWARERAEASFQIGAIEESVRDSERALALLGRPIPKSGLGWARLGVGQLVLQAWQRLRGATSGGENRQLHTTLRAAGRLMEAYVFANQPQKMIALALWAANRAPQVSAGAPLAQPFAILGLTTGMMRMDALAQRYFTLSREAATSSGVASELVGSFFLRSLYEMAFGKMQAWKQSIDVGFAAATRSNIDHQADIFRLGYALHAFINARLGECLAKIEETRASALRRHDEPMVCWCDISSASCFARMGENARADHDLSRAGRVLERVGDVAIQVNIDGLHSLVLCRLNRCEEALAKVHRTLAVFRQGPASSGMALTAYVSVAEATLGLWEKARSDHGVDSEVAQARAKDAKDALDQLIGFARMFPVGAVGVLYFRGEFARVQGATQKARALIEQSRVLAVERAMRWEEALACEALAQQTADSSERTALGQRAAELFRASDAPLRAEASLARTLSIIQA